ncbi:MAG: hypothetical protein WC321_02840 [Candidatus Omnitrophota bacterium]|jgi:hypothetical protein
MGGFKAMGLLAMIPAALLLTVSFFVLFTLRKVESRGLKVFGYVVAAFLWLAALLVVSVGGYRLTTGRYPMRPMMQKMMPGQMRGMSLDRQMPAMMHEQTERK